jgi:AAA+ ATPase superfamily predicted ATPase
MNTFRGKQFIDREEEINFFVSYFKQLPEQILFVYGPKSSGKTTLIEYVVEEKLLKGKKFWKDSNYWVKYINLRRKFITNYDSFLYAILEITEENESEAINKEYEINLKIIKISRKVMDRVKKREIDFFDVLINEIKKISRRQKAIFIIDEIQTLEDMYINGDRELLKEFLNFCVSLTKELHISHVVILSSNTVFIDRIYNEAKLKKTSEFLLIDNLGYDVVREWLGGEGFRDEEIELVWEYLGGAIPRISRLLKKREVMRSKFDLQSYLEEEAFLSYTEIMNFLTDFEDYDERNIFLEIAKKIIDDGYCSTKGISTRYKKMIYLWAEKEILFYDPLALKVVGNDRTYEKGMEILLKS